MAWILFLISVVNPDPHGSASNTKSGSGLAPDSQLDPHQRDKLDPEPDPHQFADGKPKCMKYGLI
jgi:hypothetical protein